MANEKKIKQTSTVFTEIITKLVDPTFKISKGGATTRLLNNFFKNFEKEFGAITCERLVDFCINAAYTFRNRIPILPKQIFGTASIKRLKELSRGQKFYQNEWLKSAGLSREKLIDKIKDRRIHPLAHFIYIAAEEPTKSRHLNQQVGYIICQTATLGWSPLSASCQSCEFEDQCKQETNLKYPEIYRLRTENDKSTK